MKLTVLIDNLPGAPGLVNEFGLSIFLEANGRKVLFDTGTTGMFIGNARKLGVDLQAVDLAILSHGHYDHGGGLESFFYANATAPLFLRTTADADHYRDLSPGKHYIGLDKKMLEANRQRLRWVNEDTEIAPGFHIITSIPSSEFRPDTSARLLVKKGEEYLPDTFTHELALAVKEDDGVTLITGCGHLGVLNMLAAARARFPKEKIKAVIGGFHLIGDSDKLSMAVSKETVQAIARRFGELGANKVISGHCTGKEASALLAVELGPSYEELCTGSRFEV